MRSTWKGQKLSLKVAINKQKCKVLFAEANNDVVDVLLSFLMLPLGKVVRILEMHYGSEAPVIGSLTTLYRGLSNLDSSHFCVRGAKQMLLNPTYYKDECRGLKLDISDSQLKTIYLCRDSKCPESHTINVSMYSDIAECDCGKSLNRASLVSEALVSDDDGRAFLIKSSSFIICDDLRIVPVMSGFLQTLNNLGITDTDGAELCTLSIGINDIMDLLKFSLISFTPLTDLVIKKTEKSFTAEKPPLTDLVIKKTEKSFTAEKPKAGGLLYHIPRGLVKYSRKLILKVLIQKSTNKVLFAEASDEFVEFLFSLLCIRLGGVESLLEGMTCLKNVDNLYRSVRDVIDKKCFRFPDTKDRLMSSKLPYGYISKNQFLPLSEESPPNLSLGGEKVSSWKSSKGKRNFVKGQGFYIVTDDLTVTPFSIASSISIPNSLGISLSDVIEKDFHIGVEEALSILEASLTSTTALTDVLINASTNSEDGEVLGYPLVYYSQFMRSSPHQQQTCWFEQSEKHKTFWAAILGCLGFLS